MLKKHSNKIIIKSPKKGLIKTRKFVLCFCKENGLKETDTDIFEMAVTEACHNAVRHGVKNSVGAYCELELFISQDHIKAIIKDYSEVFEVDEIDSFNLDQNFLQYKNGGLGIPLIKSLMDKVEYQHKNGNGNILTLIKNID